jgi:Membrane protein involved in the export of O-antigen and teichoic acid
MTDEKTSYRQIMKATSLFGGVQVFNIAISIIRSKVVAVLLGPAGMGIMGLLTATTGIVTSLTNFGLGTSAVKDVASANASGNLQRISVLVTTFRRLVWITGLLGALVTLVLSPWLSQLTFGNHNYTLAFIWLSITLLFNQLSSGQLVVLQGMRKLQHLAKSNVIGSALGLVVTLPLYYIWGIDGIVPGIIGTSLISLLLSSYFSGKIKLEKVKVSPERTFAEGRNMLKMGFLISLSGLLSVGASYIVRIFISHTGGVAEVGLYNAGFAIINTYVGLIFNAMGTDYYPRLSAVSHNNALCRQTINQQAEIALLILAPILIVFLVFINWVVILLYSGKFISINDMIYWAVMGMFFKAASWSIAFIFLTKSDSKLFFWNELAANLYVLIFNLIGYKLLGLTGMGISFAVAYLVYLIQVFILSNRKYQFSFVRPFMHIFGFQFTLALSAFFAVYFLPRPYPYLAGTVLIVVSVWHSFKELDKRMNIKSTLLSLKNKFTK